MIDWRYVLAKSPAPGADPTLPLERVHWFRDAGDKALNVALNRAGDTTFSVPTKEPLPEDPVLPKLFSGVDYCIICERHDDRGNIQEAFTGPLATNTGNATTKHAGKLTIKAVGWLELLTMRELREDVSYGANNNYIPHGASWGSGTTRPASYPEPNVGSAWTDADIIRDLLAKVINYAPAYAPPIRWGGAIGTRYNRQRTWTRGTKIETCFRELTELEAGIDIRVDPTTRLLWVSSWDSYVDRPEIVWGFNKPPFNVETFGWQSDFFAVRNRLPTYGSGGISALAEDTVSHQRWGIFEETLNLPDVNTPDTLVYYSHAELALKANPWIFYNFTPKAQQKDHPMLFRDFMIGDAGRLSVDHGPIVESETTIRIFAASMSMNGGIEKMTSIQTLSNQSG